MENTTKSPCTASFHSKQECNSVACCSLSSVEEPATDLGLFHWQDPPTFAECTRCVVPSGGWLRRELGTP